LKLYLGVENELLGSSEHILKTKDDLNEVHRFHAIYVCDRIVDMVSCFITPLTYEGLLDDVYGIHTGVAIIKDTSSIPVEVELRCSEEDVLFREIRNMSFDKLGPFLQSKAILVKQRYDHFRDHKDASISYIHQFVKQIPALNSDYKYLDQHISIVEKLNEQLNTRVSRESWRWERAILEDETKGFIEYIHDVIMADIEGRHVLVVLRLLCLYSLTNSGISAQTFDQVHYSTFNMGE
jgi:hypothetical protein